MTGNTKNFTDNKSKKISAENNRQWYGGKNSFQRGEIFEEKAELLEEAAEENYRRGPPKPVPNMTNRQQALLAIKVEKWEKTQAELDAKVALWKKQADNIKETITREDEIALQKYIIILKNNFHTINKIFLFFDSMFL